MDAFCPLMEFVTVIRAGELGVGLRFDSAQLKILASGDAIP